MEKNSRDIQMERSNRRIRRHDRRILFRDSERRAARGIIRLHYSLFCASIGYIFGAWGYTDEFSEFRLAVIFATTGLFCAALLGAHADDRILEEWAREIQEAEEAQKAPSYHLHHGPLGIVQHSHNAKGIHDHNFGSFFYDYQRYEL